MYKWHPMIGVEYVKFFLFNQRLNKIRPIEQSSGRGTITVITGGIGTAAEPTLFLRS